MKYLSKHLPAIFKKLRRAEALVLLLDFDGTLAPLAATPSHAKLPKSSRLLLKKCSRVFPTVVVSGRALNDVSKKIGIRGLIYGGNHGLEWYWKNKYGSVAISPKIRRSLNFAKTKLKILPRFYRGVLLEDKNLSLSLHYRGLAPSQVNTFKKSAGKVIESLDHKNLLMTKGKKVIEVRPRVSWHKGNFAKLVCAWLGRWYKQNFLPIYLGDDLTDEDAFKVLQSGLTIKVGPSRSSYAQYYVNDYQQAIIFIRRLLKIV